MASGRVLTFDDADRFQAAFRAGSYEFVAAPKARFHGGLIHIDLPQLAMQRSDKVGPVVVRSVTHTHRVPVMFLADEQQEVPQRNGMDLSADELVVHRPGSTNHLRTRGASRLAMMSLTTEDLAAHAMAITGREIAAPRQTSLVRPAPALMTRLRALHASTCQLARNDPGAWARPEVVKALEHDLIHAMIGCLAGAPSAKAPRDGGSHARVMRRFEEFLAARRLEPVYLAEICGAIGVSERTLRTCCHEHLGVGPIRYLWLRRMNLAHHALLAADPALKTVTEIVTEHGFSELGRFSGEYRALFGEVPSASLHRPAPRLPLRDSAEFA